MGKQLLKGTILGGIIIFVWMMISWMFIPWHCAVMHHFSDEEAVASVIMENASADGVYILPNLCSKDSHFEQQAEAIKKGPVVFSAVQRYGFDFDSVGPYIIAFIIQLIGAFFVTFLLLNGREMGYLRRLWFVTVFGIAVGVLASFPNWNWWGFSFSYAAIEFLDFVIAWFLAGLAIAAVGKRVVT